MAFFIVPRRFAREVPSETARFLRNHELLYRATHVMSHRHRVNHVDGAEPTWNSNNREVVTDQFGVSPKWNAGSRYYNIPAGATDTTTPWTIAGIFSFDSLVNDKAIVSHSDVAYTPNMDRAIWYASGTGLRTSIYDTGGSDRSFTASLWTTYRPAVFVATTTTSEFAWYLNGARIVGANSYGVTGKALASTSVLNVGKGNRWDTAQVHSGWLPLLIRVYGRAWSPSEAMEFCRDPWQMFEQTPEVLYFIPAAGTAYSIDAQPGTYTFTGFATTLNKALNLNAEPGSFSITGFDVTFVSDSTVDYELNAEPGSFTITGFDVSLPFGRVMNAEPGSFTITGFDSGLSRGWNLNAEAGSFIVTGFDTTLNRGWALNAEPGSFAITGIDMTMTYSTAGGGIPVTIYSGVSRAHLEGISKTAVTLTDAGGGTYNVTESPSVSENKTDSTSYEGYEY